MKNCPKMQACRQALIEDIDIGKLNRRVNAITAGLLFQKKCEGKPCEMAITLSEIYAAKKKR